MQINHEIIQTKEYFPFKIFEFHAEDLTRRVPFHWHESTELLFCVSGSLNIKFVNNQFRLTKNNALLINPNKVHATFSDEHNWILCLQLPLTFLQFLTFGKYNQKFLFTLNTLNNSQHKKKLILKLQRLSNLVNQTNKATADNILIFSVTLDIISYLVKNFQIPVTSQSDNSNLKFINLFIKFINKNYMNDVQLHDVAEYFSYSNSYCSKLIKANLGINFKSFLLSVRLNEAIKLMNQNKKGFIKIAEDCGFKNYRNFYNSFITTYNISPSKYKINRK